MLSLCRHYMPCNVCKHTHAHKTHSYTPTDLHICIMLCNRLEAYIVLTFWAETSIFPELSPAKRSRSGPNSVYVDNSRGDTFTDFGRDRPILGKWGLGRVPWSASFFVWLYIHLYSSKYDRKNWTKSTAEINTQKRKKTTIEQVTQIYI